MGGRIIDTVLMCKQLPLPFYSLGGRPASGCQEEENNVSLLFLEDGRQEKDRKPKSYQCLQVHSKMRTVSDYSKSQLPKAEVQKRHSR